MIGKPDNCSRDIDGFDWKRNACFTSTDIKKKAEAEVIFDDDDYDYDDDGKAIVSLSPYGNMQFHSPHSSS